MAKTFRRHRQNADASGSSSTGQGPKRPASSRMHPSVAKRRAQIGRDAGRRRLVMVIGMLSLVSIVVIGYEALHSSLFSVRHVSILGNSETTDQQILAASGLEKHPALINLSIAADEAAIERLPWINQADVRRNWPDSATVVVTERDPVATYRVAKAEFGLVDQTGRLLAIERLAPRGLVPIRVGALAITPGASLPAVDAALARVAAAVPLSILSSLTRIEAAPTGVVIVLRSGATAELGQASDLAAKMTALATMLATPSVVLGTHSSIDLRVPDAPVVTSL